MIIIMMIIKCPNIVDKMQASSWSSATTVSGQSGQFIPFSCSRTVERQLAVDLG